MRRPRRKHADDQDAYRPGPGWARPETSEPALPDGLTARQRRLVKTVRFHGQSPASPCLAVSDGHGWAVLHVPGDSDSAGVLRYESLCRVRTATIHEVVALNLVGAGPMVSSGEWPGLPGKRVTVPLSTWTRPEVDDDEWEPYGTPSDLDLYVCSGPV